MLVTFDKSKYPELETYLTDLLSYVRGEVEATELRNISDTLTDLESIEHTCEQVD